MEKVIDLIAPDVDKKQLSWAYEIKQLGPFFDFLSHLDEENILTEEEFKMSVTTVTNKRNECLYF